MLGRRKHHGAAVVVFFEGVEQGAGKAEVALHELFLILRTVDASEVEHEVAVTAPSVQLLRSGIQIVFIDGFDSDGRMRLVLAVLYVF